jgi:hypothetical protein
MFDFGISLILDDRFRNFKSTYSINLKIRNRKSEIRNHLLGAGCAGGGGGGAKWAGAAQPMLKTANIAASTIIDVIFFIVVVF